MTPESPRSFLPFHLACAALVLLSPRAHADTAADIRAFTGAPTRIVWIQDAGPTACVYSEKPTIRIMGFDTEDGKGERAILPDIGWYAKPLLTADGQRVVYANIANHSIEVVNFDGTGRREILRNDEAYKYNDRPFLDDAVWTDPRTGVTWVYALTVEQRASQLTPALLRQFAGHPVDASDLTAASQVTPALRRWQLDHPEISELVWDKSPVFMFMPSGDGRAASGGTFDGGNSAQGLFALPNKTFVIHHNGCWPSMSQDASHRMWVFEGNHKAILLFTPTNNTGSALMQPIEFAAPGLVLGPGEETYHPRWSNNVHFLSMDGGYPYKKWNWKSDVKIPNDVAAKIEIYLGKFNDSFTAIERWIQVTHNDRGDYWSNVWIKPSAADLAALAAGSQIHEEAAPAAPDTKGLVYTWQTGSEGNQITDPKTGSIHSCSGQLRDDARFARYSEMDLGGGAFVPDESAAPSLLSACKAANQFSLETEITPYGPPPAEEKIVMAFAGVPDEGNFVLSQKGDALLLRLKTDGAGSMQPIRICSLVQNQPAHLVISYAPGKLACYVDGKLAIIPNSLQGGLSNWTSQPLVFGDSWKAGQNWTGLMEDINFFGREIAAGEAKSRYLKQRDRTKDRKPVDTIVADAKLIGHCAPADAKQIAPYRRCLCIQLYQIVKIISGICPDQKISVAQWSVLDARVVPAYNGYVAGQTYRLVLEKMDDHPEQESERTFNGDFDTGNTQLYLQVRNPDVLSLPKPPGGAEAGYPALAGAEIVTNPSGSDLDFNGNTQIGGNGAVAAALVDDPGVDYTEAPQAQFSGGGGQGASGQPVMKLASIELNDLGGGYTSEPTVTISEPDVFGGHAATAVAQIDKVTGALAGITITDPGSGYLRVPRISFSGGGGHGVETESTLSLDGIVLTSAGSGYTAPPKITLSGGEGKGAAALAAFQSKTFRFTEPTGDALLTNSGALEQNGSALVLDWAVPTPPGRTFSFGYKNSGAWTLRNGAAVQLLTSTGSSRWIGDRNENNGVLSVLDHSRLGFSMLQNSGTLALGAGAVLGQAEFAADINTLVDRDSAVTEVLGSTPDDPATFGYAGPYGTGERVINNGGSTAGRTSMSGGGAMRGPVAQLIIGSGNDAATLAVVGGQIGVNNYPDGSFSINPGAMLAMFTNDNGSNTPTTSRVAKVTNGGQMLLAGEMRMQGSNAGFTGIENTGDLDIRGNRVVMERLPASGGPGAYYDAYLFSTEILNRPGGSVHGSGVLTYVNSTGRLDGRLMRIFNTGTLAPGQPAGQSAQESYGTLTLNNVSIRFGATVRDTSYRPPAPPPPPQPANPPQAGTLRIGIGGPPAAQDRYDALVLTGTGDVGKFELINGDGNTLNVVPAQGFTPHGSYRIVTAASLTGTFEALQYNGAAQAPYTVNYLPDGIELVFP